MKKIGHYEYYFIFEKNNHKMELGRSMMGYLDRKNGESIEKFYDNLEELLEDFNNKRVVLDGYIPKKFFSQKDKKKIIVLSNLVEYVFNKRNFKNLTYCIEFVEDTGVSFKTLSEELCASDFIEYLKDNEIKVVNI